MRLLARMRPEGGAVVVSLVAEHSKRRPVERLFQSEEAARAWVEQEARLLSVAIRWVEAGD